MFSPIDGDERDDWDFQPTTHNDTHSSFRPTIAIPRVPRLAMRDSESPPPNLDKRKSIETTAAAADISSDKPPASTGPRRDPSPSTPLQSTPSPTRKLPDGDDRRQQDSSSAILAAEPDEVHDEDEFVLTDGYDTASTGSTSVTSSVYAHSIENGRRYQHFKNGRYPIPNDDEELNREDMKHAMLLELCDGALYYAPIGDNVQKILDIGTGTGKRTNEQRVNQSIHLDA